MTNAIVIKIISLVFSVFFITSIFAQEAVPFSIKPEFAIGGFIDIFYAYDFNQPKEPYRQPFFYNHNRHNEFNLNLGLVQFGVKHSKYRAKLGLLTGTYGNDNYAAEPGLLKNIFEANVGISLNEKNSLWLDAGILPSHIGFESAISADNPTLTRSILAENSPYFLTGAKLTYSASAEWEMAALITNGWQRIERLEGNSLLSLGTQLTYKPNENVILNWSTFIGTDDPDSTRRIRYFNNLYSTFKAGDKLRLTVGFDIGAQQRTKNSSKYDIWYSPVLITRYQLRDMWSVSLRAEYYQDECGVIIYNDTPNGFQTMAFSCNLDYQPADNIVCRIEGRYLNSRGNIFKNDNSNVNNNLFVTASIAIIFPSFLSN